MNAPAKAVKPIKPAKPTSTRPRWARITLKTLKWATLLGLLLVAIGVATMAILFWKYDQGLPQIATLRDYKPKQVTRILSSDGTLLGELYEERRSYIPLERVSPVMVDAIIDAEDAGFREHGGLDFMGMMRAFWVNVRSGKTRQGASTITQQVVKTFLLTPERTFKRKIQEVILARRLEKALTKDEILTLYLNQIYWGHGRYGVEEASLFYFGKHAAELDVGEAAMLAGLVQSPENHSPLRNVDAATRRQKYVLEQMVIRGHLTAAQRDATLSAGTRVQKHAEEDRGIAPEIVEVVRKELLAKYGEDALPSLGITVKTTIDPTVQRAAREALETGLRELDARQGYRGALEKLDARKAAARRKALDKEHKGKKPREGESYEAVVVSVDDGKEEMVVDLGGYEAAVLFWHEADRRYNPDGKKPSARFAVNEVVRVRAIPNQQPRTEGVKGAVVLDQGPQGAIVVIDPRTRQVVAVVGGYDFGPGEFNRALRAKRQPGSAFKPFVYAAAMDSGEFTPASIVNDAPEVYDLWKPKNYDKKFLGPIRLRQALAASINTVAIRVMHDVGPERVVELAHAAGITSELPKELSLALGSGEVTPLELTNAFATFAADGQYAPPVFVAELGTEKLVPPEPVQAIRPEVAFLTTSLMQSVVDEGTATQAKKLRRPVAGKTGTSNDARDAWFVGYTTDLVAGVWIGFDDRRALGRGEAGGKAAVPVFTELMKTALKARSARTFRQPPGIVTVRIDKKTGKLAAPQTAEGDVISEVFLDGTAPTEQAPAPGEVDPSTFAVDDVPEDVGDAIVEGE